MFDRVYHVVRYELGSFVAETHAGVTETREEFAFKCVCDVFGSGCSKRVRFGPSTEAVGCHQYVGLFLTYAWVGTHKIDTDDFPGLSGFPAGHEVVRA
jgi:hypothetical protein